MTPNQEILRPGLAVLMALAALLLTTVLSKPPRTRLPASRPSAVGQVPFSLRLDSSGRAAHPATYKVGVAMSESSGAN